MPQTSVKKSQKWKLCDKKSQNSKKNVTKT